MNPTWSAVLSRCLPPGSLPRRQRAGMGDGKSLTMPLVRLRARAATRNILLFHPSGPGGSGVSPIRRAGPKLLVIIGEAFNLVGFRRTHMCSIPSLTKKPTELLPMQYH